MPMPMMDPKTEAINRNLQGTAQGGKPPIPGQNPQGGVPGGQPGQGGGQSPVDIAFKILDLIVQRLGQMNPEAAQKVGAALDQLKSVIEEVKKELAAGGGKPPMAGQPAGGTPPAAVPSPKVANATQPGGRRMSPQPMPQ